METEMYGKPFKKFVDVFAPTTVDEVTDNGYAEFKNWYLNDSGLSDGVDDVPSKKTFTLIKNEYSDSSLAFTVEGFKEHFANDLYTYYKEFEATTNAIDNLMQLSDDDIEVGDQTINNFADIPETGNDTDTKTVDFISNSTKTMYVEGKLQVKKEILSTKRIYTVKTFLNRFRHLFRRILSNSYNRVWVEEQED